LTKDLTLPSFTRIDKQSVKIALDLSLTILQAYLSTQRHLGISFSNSIVLLQRQEYFLTDILCLESSINFGGI